MISNFVAMGSRVRLKTYGKRKVLLCTRGGGLVQAWVLSERPLLTWLGTRSTDRYIRGDKRQMANYLPQYQDGWRLLL